MYMFSMFFFFKNRTLLVEIWCVTSIHLTFTCIIQIKTNLLKLFMFWYVIGTLRVFWQMRTFLWGECKISILVFFRNPFEVRSIDGTYSVGIVSLLGRMLMGMYVWCSITTTTKARRRRASGTVRQGALPLLRILWSLYSNFLVFKS